MALRAWGSETPRHDWSKWGEGHEEVRQPLTTLVSGEQESLSAQGIVYRRTGTCTDEFSECGCATLALILVVVIEQDMRRLRVEIEADRSESASWLGKSSPYFFFAGSFAASTALSAAALAAVESLFASFAAS